MNYGRFLQNFNDLSKYISENILQEGAVAVDCTVGNGNDTLYLARKVGKRGRVYGFDVQEPAIAKARERLEGEGLANRVQLILDGHENIGRHIEEEIDFAVFNLGYLPKGDHSITTKTETTLKAVGSAIEKLKPKGTVSIMAYVGHDGGNDENTAVRSFIEGLDSKQYNVVCTNFINKPNNPPILYLVQRNR